MADDGTSMGDVRQCGAVCMEDSFSILHGSLADNGGRVGLTKKRSK